MYLSLFIAKRYLFSRKKQHAINIISIISMGGVMIGTTALIVILSVFNGIDLFLQKSMNSLTADLIISPVTGKFMEQDSLVYRQLEQNPSVLYFNPVVEENALLKYGDRLKPVFVKGVEPAYEQSVGFGQNLIQGTFTLKTGDVYSAVVGYGVAAELGVGLSLLTPMKFYYPNRESSSVNSALSMEYLFPAGIFTSQQETDGQLVITDIEFARRLFRIGDKISKIEIRLKDEAATESVKQELSEGLEASYKVEDKYELNRSFYTMMKSEKLAVFLILLFIFLIASFNIVGSISMLILDKKEDLVIYQALGMPVKRIISVFQTEGNMITWIGAFLGLFVGVGVCFLQQTYGFIKLGDGNYMMEAYPVQLVFGDIALIIITVLAIGYIASYFPVRYLVRKLILC